MLIITAFLFGVLVGWLQNQRWRRDRRAALCRKLQLVVQRNEAAGLRRQGRRPYLLPWQKWLLGFLHRFSPTLTRYTLFRPETFIRWHRRYVKRYWWLLSNGRSRSKAGRPRVPDSVEQIILAIKAANQGYGAPRIASILTEQLKVPISESTVRNVLKRNPLPGNNDPGSQRWLTFLRNHRNLLASMDFKVTFDWRARPLYILSIVNHCRRELAYCRSTYHPTAAWVAQQLRESFPFDDGPAKFVIDHDSIFLPVVRNTLPAMGIDVVRTAVKCPWQNGAVERFNRTLTEELLDHIIPISDIHLNRLLANYRTFYNSARPHQANDGQAPLQHEVANSENFIEQPLRVEAVSWLNGLHHSYRHAA